MKNLKVLLVAAALILPASAALAQVGAAGRGGGGGGGGPAGGGPNASYEECMPTEVGPGYRATREFISKAKSAIIVSLEGCEELYVEERFGLGGQSAAITKNKKLARYLRGQGFAPEQVRGVQDRRGTLIVYAETQ